MCKPLLMLRNRFVCNPGVPGYSRAVGAMDSNRLDTSEDAAESRATQLASQGSGAGLCARWVLSKISLWSAENGEGSITLLYFFHGQLGCARFSRVLRNVQSIQIHAADCPECPGSPGLHSNRFRNIDTGLGNAKTISETKSRNP